MPPMPSPVLNHLMLEQSKARAVDKTQAAIDALSERERLQLPRNPSPAEVNRGRWQALLDADLETLAALRDDEAKARALVDAINAVREKYPTPYGNQECDPLLTAFGRDLNLIAMLQVRIRETRAKLG